MLCKLKVETDCPYKISDGKCKGGTKCGFCGEEIVDVVVNPKYERKIRWYETYYRKRYRK